MKILIVKLSSLGDVLHNLPIVWDLRAKYPDAQIDWVVEEGYVELLTPLQTSADFRGIDRIIPFALRRWKKDLKKGEFVKSIQEYLAFKKFLGQARYDLVLDTQGLIKSAYVSRLASRTQSGRIFGLANQTEFSGSEPLARKFYSDLVQVPFQCHAVDRSRMVAAAAMDLPVPDRTTSPPKFYPSTYLEELHSSHIDKLKVERDFGFDLSRPHVFCFHSTAGESKRWSKENWLMVGQYLTQKGFQVIFPWGNPKEKEVSESIVKGISAAGQARAIVPKSFSVAEAFGLISGATLTIGVDTGLTHLSAILNVPTIELYCDSPKWKTEGYWAQSIRNLGDKGNPPEISMVKNSVDELLMQAY